MLYTKKKLQLLYKRTSGTLNKKILDILFFLSIFIFVIVVIIVILRQDGGMVSYHSDLLKNVVTLNNADLLYVIDNGTFIHLKAEKGIVDIIDYNMNMENVDVLYTRSDYVIEARADRGEYLSQRFLKAYDNITGTMDNMTFTTGPNGILEYDYIEGKGIVQNSVKIMQNNNSISSEIVEFDVNNNFIIFRDNVTIDYISNEQ